MIHGKKALGTVQRAHSSAPRLDQQIIWGRGTQRVGTMLSVHPRPCASISIHGCWQRGLGGGRLSPLCLPVSHADLSHALTSSKRERDYGLSLPAAEPSPHWPAQELIPWEGPSCSPLSASGSPSAGTPPGCCPPPVASRTRQSPRCPSARVCSPTHSPVSPQPLSSCLGSGHGLTDKAGPGSGSSGEGQRSFRLRNNRMLAS